MELEYLRIILLKRMEEWLYRSSYPGKLKDAALYATSSGKRIRPLLVLLTAETFEGSIDKALDAASALEMIHSYSLIHDDLPCMDDDDFRRGRPTVHKIYGEATALLAGDFLLTLAFEIINGSHFLSSSEKASLSFVLAKKAGAKGMVGGQQKDLESEGKEISVKELLFLHCHKTALLFSAAFEFGGIVSGATARDRRTLSQAGKRFGLAYQIADDLADDSSDIRKKKASACTVLGEEKAVKMLDSLYNSALTKLDSMSHSPHLLKSFIANSLPQNVAC